MEIKDLKVGDFLYRPGYKSSNTGVFRVYSIGTYQNHDDFIRINTHDDNCLCANVDSLDSNNKLTFNTFYKDDLAECEIITYERYQEILIEIGSQALKPFSQYIDVLRTVFPDRTVTVEEEGVIYSYILIDEETVNSSNGVSSTVIRDFVFKLKFSYDSLENTYVLSGINGQIFRATEKQADFGYAHSHVTSAGVTGWGGCCFGGTTDLAKTRGKLMAKMEPIKFQLFLYQLKDFLKHESLKGGPYRRITNMYRGGGSLSSHVPDSHLDNVEASIGPYKIEVMERNGTIICEFDRDDLSKAMLLTGAVLSKYTGKMVDGDFIYNDAGNNISSTGSYLNALGLNVSDDYCTISLVKTIHDSGVKEKTEGIENAPIYVCPRFMDAYEQRYKGLYESIILNKILNEENKKSTSDSESEAVSQNQLPSFIDG